MVCNRPVTCSGSGLYVATRQGIAGADLQHPNSSWYRNVVGLCVMFSMVFGAFILGNIVSGIVIDSLTLDEDIYKKELLWKILKEKDLQKSAQESRYKSNMQVEEMLEAQRNLESEIFRLEKMDERKITDEDLSRAQKLKIKHMEQEHL